MNKKEAIKAMLNGEKVRGVKWGSSGYLRYSNTKEGFIDESEIYIHINGQNPSKWEIVKKTQRINLYAYVQASSSSHVSVSDITYKSADNIHSDKWKRAPGLDKLNIEVED